MAGTVSSKRYAQAIFQIARGKDQMEQWQSSLQQIKTLVQNEQLADVMENPRLHFDQKSKILSELLVKADPLVLNFVYLLILKNKFRQGAQIADQYELLLDELKGTKRASIVTAMSLDEAGKNRLVKDLEATMGSKLKAEFSVDPEIIGGFIARFDGTLLDGSVKYRLNALRNKLISVKK
jgi:F-type H+-transporting ATPase subunit delta